jgi:hypothetical protein
LNIERRHLNKGQTAIVVARAYPKDRERRASQVAGRNLILTKHVSRMPVKLFALLVNSPCPGAPWGSPGNTVFAIRSISRNQNISVLRLCHAHHRGVQGRRTCAHQLPWRTTRGDLSGRPAAQTDGTEGVASPVPSCGPVCRTGKGGKTTEVGDEIDRHEIWRTMDQLTEGPDVQEVLQDYPVKVWTYVRLR